MSFRAYPIVVGLWVVAAVLAVAWSLRVVTPAPAEEEVGGLDALPELPSVGRASFETEDTLPSALQGVAVEPVQGGWTGPGGGDFHIVVRSRREVDYSHRQIGRRSFYLGLRLTDPEISHVPCSSCHEGQGMVEGRDPGDEESVHQNIRPVHPEETGAQCLTCHAAADVGSLALERGGTVSIDHAYRLCAQCHFRQVESWAYGAHGKRLVGWRGRRVVMTCADCHDPHRPAVQQRMPMAGLGLPGPLRTEGEGQEEGASHD